LKNFPPYFSSKFKTSPAHVLLLTKILAEIKYIAVHT